MRQFVTKITSRVPLTVHLEEKQPDGTTKPVTIGNTVVTFKGKNAIQQAYGFARAQNGN